MKNKMIRSAAFTFAVLLGGAGMVGTASARPNIPGRVGTTKTKVQPNAGCKWNGVDYNHGDTQSSTVHHADGTSTVVTYTCTNGTWVS
jgi:hypothetical protein